MDSSPAWALLSWCGGSWLWVGMHGLATANTGAYSEHRGRYAGGLYRWTDDQIASKTPLGTTSTSDTTESSRARGRFPRAKELSWHEWCRVEWPRFNWPSAPP